MFFKRLCISILIKKQIVCYKAFIFQNIVKTDLPGAVFFNFFLVKFFQIENQSAF